MTDVTMTSEITVKLIRASAADEYVVQAAQVSSKGENNPETDMPRLINALMKDRHGSPFEHTSFTFFAKAPIFVFREWWRHRMSSINEMSGRYTELLPEFYTVDDQRIVINSGSSMRPKYEQHDPKLTHFVNVEQREQARLAWASYQAQLEQGVAKEVARMVLPVSVYSQAYWTVNARSLMNFISLRTGVTADEGAAKPSHPQREIEKAAEIMEVEFGRLMPHTHMAFVRNGRLAP